MSNPGFLTKLNTYIFAGLCATVFYRCSPANDSEIDYLGQQPPGMQAEVFAPGIVSTNRYEHSAPAFAPDGSVVLWTVMDTAKPAFLLEMKYANGTWSAPARPTFADTTADDYYPSFSIDGKKLYFSSRRKPPPGYSQGGDIRIWEVARHNNEWGKPQPCDTAVFKEKDYAHSVSAKGTIYFSSSLGGGTNFNIRKAAIDSGHYGDPVLLPFGINSIGYEDGPYISPDESFLIFESQRPDPAAGDLGLYISFRHQGGGWGLPINMGPRINSGKGERFARLSPDGKYLFFGSYRNSDATHFGADIFWIDAGIIDELRASAPSIAVIPEPLGDQLLQALYNNDGPAGDTLLRRWLKIYPHDIDATIIYSALLRKQGRYPEAGQLLASVPRDWHQFPGLTMEQALLLFAAGRDEEATVLLEKLVGQGDQAMPRSLDLANSLFEMKKFEPSDRYFERAMAIHPSAVAWYNRACGYTHIGQKDRAFLALDNAVSLGYKKKSNYEGDPDLVPLQSDRRWKKLVEKLDQ